MNILDDSHNLPITKNIIMDSKHTQFSHVDLEEILDLSYLEPPNGLLYQCITTPTRFLLYRDNNFVDAHYFEAESIYSQEIKTHVYSSQNSIVFIKNGTFETWKVKEDKLILSNTHKFDDINNLEYVFQDIIDADNRNIKSACLIGYLNDTLRIWQVCFDNENDESYIVFQQSLWIEGYIDDLCMFPVDSTSLDFSACAIRTEDNIKIITISMPYISNAQRYLEDLDIIKKVSDMKLQYKVDGGDPLTFNKLDNFGNNKLKNKKILILNYREVIMGSYYLNLNLLYSGELPRHIDDLKITNSFSKYRKTYSLSKDLQTSFIKMIDNKDELKNTECCLVQHANSMISIMFYNSNLINLKDPSFVNLTYVKDIKSLKFFKDLIFGKFNLLLYVGNKVRSGTIDDINNVIKKGNKLNSSLSLKYNEDDKKKNMKVKTYANINELALLIKILPFECSNLYVFEKKLKVESDYKKMKILNDKDTKHSDEYLFYVNNNFNNNSILTNILSGNKYDLQHKGFKFIESLQGFLYLEMIATDHKVLMNLKLLVYADNKWISKELVSKFHKKFPIRFHDLHKTSVKFMPNIYDSNEVTGLLTYVDKEDIIECYYFSIYEKKEVEVSYKFDIDNGTSNHFEKEEFNIETHKEKGMIQSKIQAKCHIQEETSPKSNVIILEPKFFNADIDIFWIVSDLNLQVVVINKVDNQELKFWSYQKHQDVNKKHWLDSSNWCVSSDGSKCIFSSNNELKVFDILEEYFIDFNIDNKLLVDKLETNSIDSQIIKMIDLDFKTSLIFQFFVDNEELKVRVQSLDMIVLQSTLTPISHNSTINKDNDKIFSMVIANDENEFNRFKLLVGYKNLVNKVGRIREYDLTLSP